MQYLRFMIASVTVMVCLLAATGVARAQGQAADESKWAVDVGVGIDFGVNGNVNSGAIGRLNGLATAFLPRAMATSTARASSSGLAGPTRSTRSRRCVASSRSNRPTPTWCGSGTIGPSSLYGQYSDYQASGSMSDTAATCRSTAATSASTERRPSASGSSMPSTSSSQRRRRMWSSIRRTSTNQTSAFTWSFGAGILFTIAEHIDLNAQVGLRHVSGLSEVDQFAGTGLEDINNDSGRLTFPVIVGLRYHF